MDGLLRNGAVSRHARHRRHLRRGALPSAAFAHYDDRCFLPIHVYDTDKSRPVVVILRPGKTPSGVEVRAHLRRLVRHIRSRFLRLASCSGAMGFTPALRQ